MNLVETIKVFVLEGEGVVEVGHLEGEPISEAGSLGILFSNFNLCLVNVNSSHLGASNGTDMVGDTSTSTPDIEDMRVGLEVQVAGHFPLEQDLVLEDGAVQVHDGRDVHLLDLPDGTKLVDHGIVVLDMSFVVDRISHSLLVEKLIGIA